MVGVAETSFSYGIIPFFTIPLLYIVIPEYTKYTTDLSGFSPGYTALLTFLCIGISISKLIDRVCKFSLVITTSTMFFASVDCAMKVVAGFGSIIFFNDGLSWTEIVGFVLIIASFVPMRYGSHKEKQKQPVHVLDELDLRMSVAPTNVVIELADGGRSEEAAQGRLSMRHSMGARPSIALSRAEMLALRPTSYRRTPSPTINPMMEDNDYI